MKRLTIVPVALAVVLLLGSPALAAQHHPGGQAPMGGQPGQPTPPPAVGGPQPPMMGSGMMGMMCPMMHQMMGGQMGAGGMMGMMGGQMGAGGMMGGGPTDPKTLGRLLQMRGEMFKAMGEIMQKHGKLLEEK